MSVEEKMKSGMLTQVKLRWVFKLYIFIRALTLAQSRSLLEKGLFEAARRCLGECGSYHFKTAKKTVYQRRHFQDWLRCPRERWIGHEESWWIAPTAMHRLNKMGGLRSIFGTENPFKGESRYFTFHLQISVFTEICVQPFLLSQVQVWDKWVDCFFPAIIVGSCADL